MTLKTARTLPMLHKANVLAASAHALASLVICCSYELWLPHPVGYIFPAAAALTSGIWAVHCWILGIAATDGRRDPALLRWALIPLAIALIAGTACWFRYQQEIPKHHKISEWFQKNST